MFRRNKTEVAPKLFDVTVQMTNYKTLAVIPQRLAFACVIEIKRHTHELEIIQFDNRHTFINACDYVSYWYTKA